MARPTRTMLIAGLAVVAAAAIGGGATYLATTSSSQAATAQAGAAHGHAGKARQAREKKAERAGAAGGGMLGKIEHGEFTTASAGVMQIQRGAITAIDAGSVTAPPPPV